MHGLEAIARINGMEKEAYCEGCEFIHIENEETPCCHCNVGRKLPTYYEARYTRYSKMDKVGMAFRWVFFGFFDFIDGLLIRKI